MKKIKGTPTIDAEKSSVQETFSLPEQYAHAAGLKKKERQKGGSKRNKNWVDKLTKKKKKNSNKKKKSKPAQHEECESPVPKSQEYESIRSFTQVLMVC